MAEIAEAAQQPMPEALAGAPGLASAQERRLHAAGMAILLSLSWQPNKATPAGQLLRHLTPETMLAACPPGHCIDAAQLQRIADTLTRAGVDPFVVFHTQAAGRGAREPVLCLALSEERKQAYLSAHHQ